MNQTESNFVWLTCPKCRWRREFPQSAVKGDARCRQCGTAVIVSPPPAVEAILPEDTLMMEEPVELPPASGVQHVTTPSEVEYQLAPSPLPRPPMMVRSDVARGSVSEEKPREDVVTPPRRAGLAWAFTNNVFDFPFQKYSLAQWVCASLGLIVGDELALLALMGLYSGTEAGALQAGCFGIAAFFALLFSLSYLAASFLDITVNAAHNVDKAHDWPDSNWRDRMWSLVRVVWWEVIAGTLAAAIAGLASFIGDFFGWACLVFTFLLTPIVVLSALEADVILFPISRPIFRTLRMAWSAWALFYVLTAILWTPNELVTRLLYNRSPFLMPLAAGPVLAATVFIYGRLLGRLAWFILRSSDSEQDRKTEQRMVEQERWEM